MSKLIDADALIESIKKDRANAEGKISLSVMRDIAVVMDQPDASEPLREEIAQAKARIAELEEQNKRMDIALRNCLHLSRKVPLLDADEVQSCLVRFCAEAGVNPSILRGAPDA